MKVTPSTLKSFIRKNSTEILIQNLSSFNGQIDGIESSEDQKFIRMSFLWKACLEGNLELVKQLVQEGANIHAQEDYAIRWASENGHLDVVKFLVQHGADIHAQEDYAIRWASCNGHLDVVKFLVQHGADIHKALRWVIDEEQFDVVDYLKSIIRKEKIKDLLKI